MAFASVTTKVDTGIMSRRIVQILTGGAGVGDAIDTEMLPYGSAHIVNTGASVTSVALTAANDGLVTAGGITLTNAVGIGAANTACSGAAAIVPVSIGALLAGTTAADLSGKAVVTCPYRFIQFVVAGGSATSVVTITIELMGSRG